MLGSYRHISVQEGLGVLLQQLRELGPVQVVIYRGALHGVLVVDVDDALQGELQVGFHFAREKRAEKC